MPPARAGTERGDHYRHCGAWMDPRGDAGSTRSSTARRSSNTVVTASDIDDQATYHVERAPDRNHLIAFAIVLLVTPKWAAIA